MIFALYFLFVVSVFAHGASHIGSLMISRIGYRHVHKSLILKGGIVCLGNHLTLLKYDVTGAILTEDMGAYLGINNLGKLTSGTFPQTKFLLTLRKGYRTTKVLSFDYEERFELCEDNSIGLKSGCTGAQPITIVFEDLYSIGWGPGEDIVAYNFF